MGSLDCYVIVGFFDSDDTPPERACDPAEIFLNIAKHGSTLGGLVDGLAVTASVALQSGTPWATICKHWRHTRFGDENNAQCSSLLDGFAQAVDYCIEERKKVLGIEDSIAPVPDQPSKEEEAIQRTILDQIHKSMDIAAAANDEKIKRQLMDMGWTPPKAVMEQMLFGPNDGVGGKIYRMNNLPDGTRIHVTYDQAQAGQLPSSGKIVHVGGEYGLKTDPTIRIIVNQIEGPPHEQVVYRFLDSRKHIGVLTIPVEDFFDVFTG